MNNLIEVRDLSKTFTLHQQQGVVLNVLRGLNFNVAGGECLVLHGRSGAGKSTLLRTLYGNYMPACATPATGWNWSAPSLARCSPCAARPSATSASSCG